MAFERAQVVVHFHHGGGAVAGQTVLIDQAQRFVEPDLVEKFSLLEQIVEG